MCSAAVVGPRACAGTHVKPAPGLATSFAWPAHWSLLYAPQQLTVETCRQAHIVVWYTASVSTCAAVSPAAPVSLACVRPYTNAAECKEGYCNDGCCATQKAPTGTTCSESQNFSGIAAYCHASKALIDRQIVVIAAAQLYETCKGDTVLHHQHLPKMTPSVAFATGCAHVQKQRKLCHRLCTCQTAEQSVECCFSVQVMSAACCLL